MENNSKKKININEIDSFIPELINILEKDNFFKNGISSEDIEEFKKEVKEYFIKTFEGKSFYYEDTLIKKVKSSSRFKKYSQDSNYTSFIKSLSSSWDGLHKGAIGKKKSYLVGLIIGIAAIVLLTIFAMLLDSVSLLVLDSICILVVICFVYPLYSSSISEKNSFEQLPKEFKAPLALVGACLFLGFYYYLVLPPLSLRSSSFIFFLMLCIGGVGLSIIYALKLFLFSKKENGNAIHHKVNYYFLIGLVGLTLAYSLAGTLSGVDLFRAKDLASLLPISHVYDEDTIYNDFNYQGGDIILPTHDKDMAYRQAEITLSDYGNQYYINQDHFTVQSLEHDGVQQMVRVAPLEYSNFFLSLQNNNIGTPGYILVDLVTGQATLVDDYPLVYIEEAKLQTDIARHIRLKNIYALYDNIYFEIDDNYVPYWVVPVYERKVGLFNGKLPSKVITINANTGVVNDYEIDKAPSWIDNVVDREIVEQLANYALRYQKGYINATIGTKDGVYIIDDGYNYFIKDGEPFFVSSVTSSDERDQTSIGFLTISLRTMEANFYHTTGVTENRAMEIAELDDSVKAMNLSATWPIFIDIEKTPTYFLTLKNDVQVQKYVFINQKSGSDPIIGDSLLEAYEAYLASIGAESQEDEITGVVSRINVVNNYLYLSLGSDNSKIYQIDFALDPRLYILKEGDTISFNAITQNNIFVVTHIVSITFKTAA